MCVCVCVCCLCAKIDVWTHNERELVQQAVSVYIADYAYYNRTILERGAWLKLPKHSVYCWAPFSVNIRVHYPDDSMDSVCIISDGSPCQLCIPWFRRLKLSTIKFVCYQ